MKGVRVALGVAGVLLAGLGMVACTGRATCLCFFTTTASKFAYVIGSSDSVAAFTITPGTGSLVPVSGSPFGAGGTPMFGAADPAGKFLYVADPGTQVVFGFSIDPSTGGLTPVPGTRFPLRASKAEMPVVDPTGSFLYVTHLDSCGDDCQGAISAFKIGTDGSLTEIAGSPYTTDYGTLGIAVHPSGKFVFAINGQNCCRIAATVSAFQVDPASGALTEINGSPFVAGEAIPLFAAVHPGGNFLYVTEQNLSPTSNGFVVTFSIDATSGALTPISGFSTGAGLNPQGIDVDAIDSLLFVANSGTANAMAQVDGSISAYRMNGTTGALTAVSGSPFATRGSNPLQLAVDRSCRFLYVTNLEGGRGSTFDYALGFTIDSLTGNLTTVPGSPFSTSSSGPPGGIVLTPHRAATSTGP
jgi:6-phosphogluconolactonase (cycloisomerase 2 family)